MGLNVSRCLKIQWALCAPAPTDQALHGFRSGTRYAPVAAVAEMMGLGESTVRRYDMAVLKEDLPEPNLDGLRVLIIDEKSIRRGHGYVTLVLKGETGELLHMAEGKKKASLEPFSERLTDKQKASIEAVCIDRAGSY
ncbi:MAG: transposase [Verrucomicrobiales bacterium]|jgi:transposase